jgi:hypothetical protein
MDPAQHVRSFSRADRAVMREVYARCLVEMGLSAGSTVAHRAIARAILDRYAAGATDIDGLVRQVIGRKRRPGIRRLWASLFAILTGRHAAA